MERRTQPGYEYHSCDFMDDGVYIDMNLLREYEDTGLTPQEIMEMKERDTAKNPVPSQFKSEMVCPVCGSTAYPWNTFCDECGQRLWDDEKP